ncbi:longitudinals lacking protein, isoforms A/B/D/L-like [Bacillus rossius redtenbacheri]|uniref:longitudinals lacking protein, isoforms A/B/D/L-like n=1 Tax=Bacillus rossius redtenbacheri TaxID=93214 RepID=UPI002FDF0903
MCIYSHLFLVGALCVDYSKWVGLAGGECWAVDAARLPPAGASSYPCRSCGRRYRQQCSRWRHENYECGKAATFQCPACCYKAKHKFNMQKHVRLKHAWLGGDNPAD